jgi:hypothetical protein
VTRDQVDKEFTLVRQRGPDVATTGRHDVALDPREWVLHNPLCCALLRGHYDNAAILFEAGASFGAEFFYGRPPFAFVRKLLGTGRNRGQGLAIAGLMLGRALEGNAVCRTDGVNKNSRCEIARSPRQSRAVSCTSRPRSSREAMTSTGGSKVTAYATRGRSEFDCGLHTTPLEFATALGCLEPIGRQSRTRRLAASGAASATCSVPLSSWSLRVSRVDL